MGNYITATALQARMIGTEFDTATSALAVEMVSDAESEVNKYLSKRYDIAALIADVPPMVETWTKRLAEGYMHMAMSRGGKESLARGQGLVDGVLANLKLVSEYKLDLTEDDGTVIADMSNGGFRILSNTGNYNSTFNEGDPKKWKVDRTKLDDIDAED